MRKRNKYYIKSSGQLLEVTEEVYREFYQTKRREKYQQERDRRHGLIHSGGIDKSRDSQNSNTQDIVFRSLEDALLDQELQELLHDIIMSLPRADRDLIHALYFEKKSERSYAKMLGLSHTAIQKRRRKTLTKLRNILDNIGYPRF